MNFTCPESKIVLHYYHLPSEKGEGWARVLISSDGMFSAVSDYGNYGYFWSHHGMDDIRRFFLRVKTDKDYFINKLTIDRPRVYDGEATVKQIKKQIIETRRECKGDSKKYSREWARKEWNRLSDCGVLDYEQGFNQWYEYSQLDEAYEYKVMVPCPQAVAFVEKVMIRLERILRAELELTSLPSSSSSTEAASEPASLEDSTISGKSSG